jgi:uncharacterized protein
VNILNDLISSLSDDAPVRSVLVGAHWTVVCSRFCGIASTILGDKPHAHHKVRDVGTLHQKSARELARFAYSDNPLEASIGVAAINSLLELDEESCVELNAADLLIQRGNGRKIALVGHFPFIPKLRQAARQLWIIEQEPVEDEFPAERANELLPEADVVALTGSALINHTLDSLLALCQKDALVIVLGPSTPLSPVLFQYGVSVVSGTRIFDEEAVIRTVGQGASFQQVAGVRLLTMLRPEARS